MIDSCDQVGKDIASKSYAETNGEWKNFNSFEQRDQKFRSKEVLKDEINNIAMRIVKAREAQMSMTYHPDLTSGSFKVPDVE